MALAESWHIRSRARSCAASERPFEDGERIMTALFPDPESSGYVRRDFGLPEWKSRDVEATGGTPFSFWKAVYHAPAAPGAKPDAFRRESPEELLRRLVEEDEDHTENARYILAVMLERKKVLRETDTQRTPSGILRVYEHRKLGDVFIVKDPDIPLSDVERVQTEVMELLDQSNRPAEEEEAAPAAAAVENSEASAEGESAEIAAEEVVTAEPEESPAGESTKAEEQTADEAGETGPASAEEEQEQTADSEHLAGEGPEEASGEDSKNASGETGRQAAD